MLSNKKKEDDEDETKSNCSKSTSSSTNSNNPKILVHSRQRGNPLLKSLKFWEFTEEILPDYVTSKTTGIIFLSIRYHNLNPEYIHERLKKLGNKSFDLRVLLALVDVAEPHHALKQLMRISILTDLSLILAWSYEEAGKIVDTYNKFHDKPPDLIMENFKFSSSESNPLVDALTTIKSVNKSDAAILITTFGSLEGIFNASEDDLSLCPGFGPQKAKRLSKVLHENFKKN